MCSSDLTDQEEPGGTRRDQEEPGGTRRNQEEPGGTRRNQEDLLSSCEEGQERRTLSPAITTPSTLLEADGECWIRYVHVCEGV